MNEMSAMPSRVAEWLSQREELNDIIFLTEFPPVKKAVPLKKVTVAVGIHSIVINDRFEAGETGDDEYCRAAEITLRFSVHAPFSMGGGACHEAFADITDCLTFDSGLEITESGCEIITADRDTEALVLNARAVVKASLCPAQSSDMQFPSFLDKTLLCGTHIRDTSIHLSPEEKEFLSEPLITGSYQGMGQSVRNIDLGFSPSLVIVFAGGLPLIAADGANLKAYSAAAVSGSGSAGLEITQNGFRVKSGAAHISENCIPLLNEAGTGYTYIAMKR